MSHANRIVGTGEMARLTREFGWEDTPLGSIANWSESLLCSVNLMLCCRFPTIILWGAAMIQLYNDDYLPLMADKHPAALGQPARQCWREAWHIIGPQFEAALLDGTTSFKENVLVPVVRDGVLTEVYWTYSYSPIHFAEGTVAGVIVVCQDKTREIVSAREHAQAQQQIAEDAVRLTDLFQQAPAFIALLHGPDHIFEMLNPPYQRLIGKRELLGRPVVEVIPEVAPQGYIQLLDKVYETGEALVSQGARIMLDRTLGQPSEERILDFVYQPRRGGNGQVTGIIVLGVDVTERKRAEDSLIRSERLATVGRLASSIAHEINNPLESVTNLLYLSRGAEGLPAEVAGYLETAEIELRRVSVITNQTLSFYKQSASPTQVTCSALFESVLSVYQGRLLNSAIEVVKRKRSGRAIFCFEGEIRQVLSNLVGNALDAMAKSGGRLLLRSREATSWKSGQRGLMFTVADTGGGISAEHQAVLFEAFFTTKGAAGNGLGLWVSQDIVARHKGSLHVRSSQGMGHRGTVFTLFLPFEAVAR